MTLLKNFLVDEQGQDMIEYALLLVFVALACAVAFPAVVNQLKSVWTNVATSLQNGAGS